MNVALRKTSLVDYPGRPAAVLFLSGCNLRCPWCHNAALVTGNAEGLMPLDEAVEAVCCRRSKVGAVVLSGGEPTLFAGLAALITRFHNEGFLVKIDTNGTKSEFLASLIRDAPPDYIAMDLKLAPERYAEILPENTALTRTELAASLAESARLVRESGIPHEFRSLKLPEFYFTERDIAALRPLAGESAWNCRPFRSGAETLVPHWGE